MTSMPKVGAHRISGPMGGFAHGVRIRAVRCSCGWYVHLPEPVAETLPEGEVERLLLTAALQHVDDHDGWPDLNEPGDWPEGMGPPDAQPA